MFRFHKKKAYCTPPCTAVSKLLNINSTYRRLRYMHLYINSLPRLGDSCLTLLRCILLIVQIYSHGYTYSWSPRGCTCTRIRYSRTLVLRHRTWSRECRTSRACAGVAGAAPWRSLRTRPHTRVHPLALQRPVMRGLVRGKVQRGRKVWHPFLQFLL